MVWLRREFVNCSGGSGVCCGMAEVLKSFKGCGKKYMVVVVVVVIRWVPVVA